MVFHGAGSSPPPPSTELGNVWDMAHLPLATTPPLVVRFTTQVQTTVEDFNASMYQQRMSAELGGAAVGVRVSPGSVVVTTSVGADSQEEAQQLVGMLQIMSGDADLLGRLYGAVGSLNSSSISISESFYAFTPPPSAPHTHPDEDHTVLALVIILSVLMPAALFLVYLQCAQTVLASTSTSIPIGTPLAPSSSSTTNLRTSSTRYENVGARSVSFRFVM